VTPPRARLTSQPDKFLHCLRISKFKGLRAATRFRGRTGYILFTSRTSIRREV
jgi:hypothetical protein